MLFLCVVEKELSEAARGETTYRETQRRTRGATTAR